MLAQNRRMVIFRNLCQHLSLWLTIELTQVVVQVFCLIIQSNLFNDSSFMFLVAIDMQRKYLLPWNFTTFTNIQLHTRNKQTFFRYIQLQMLSYNQMLATCVYMQVEQLSNLTRLHSLIHRENKTAQIRCTSMHNRISSFRQFLKPKGISNVGRMVFFYKFIVYVEM